MTKPTSISDAILEAARRTEKELDEVYTLVAFVDELEITLDEAEQQIVDLENIIAELEEKENGKEK